MVGMNGKVAMSILVASALIFGAAMYYFQVYAYYEEIGDLDALEVDGQDIPVTAYRGIDAQTSPNKLRGCFNVDPGAFEAVPLAPDPDPLSAPGWFDCFDARSIAADLSSGAAIAYLAADETPDGAVGYEILRMIAVYPDGRGYIWRHYREKK